MIDQEKLEFKNKYKDNPVAFCEEVLGIKLYEYQKQILNALHNSDTRSYYYGERWSGKKFLLDMQIEYVKAMKANFRIVTPQGIEVYENGEYVRTDKYKNRT